MIRLSFDNNGAMSRASIHSFSYLLNPMQGRCGQVHIPAVMPCCVLYLNLLCHRTNMLMAWAYKRKHDQFCPPHLHWLLYTLGSYLTSRKMTVSHAGSVGKNATRRSSRREQMRIKKPLTDSYSLRAKRWESWSRRKTVSLPCRARCILLNWQEVALTLKRSRL